MHPDRPAVEPAVLTTLERMIQRAPGRVSRRAQQAVGWRPEGQRPAQIARRLGVARQSVARWCARFRAEDPAGLRDRPRPGRPPRAGAAALLAAWLAGRDVPGPGGPGGWRPAGDAGA